MAKEEEKMVYCMGKDEDCDCPLKETCLRYKEDIDKMADLWLAWVTYEEKRQKCKHYKPAGEII